MEVGLSMVKTASLFSQLLVQVTRTDFAALAKKRNAERHARGFTCWTRFVGMFFCQLAHADSFAEVYRELMDWLDDPLNTPPYASVPEQLELALA